MLKTADAFTQFCNAESQKFDADSSSLKKDKKLKKLIQSIANLKKQQPKLNLNEFLKLEALFLLYVQQQQLDLENAKVSFYGFFAARQPELYMSILAEKQPGDSTEFDVLVEIGLTHNSKILETVVKQKPDYVVSQNTDQTWAVKPALLALMQSAYSETPDTKALADRKILDRFIESNFNKYAHRQTRITGNLYVVADAVKLAAKPSILTAQVLKAVKEEIQAQNTSRNTQVKSNGRLRRWAGNTVHFVSTPVRVPAKGIANSRPIKAIRKWFSALTKPTDIRLDASLFQQPASVDVLSGDISSGDNEAALPQQTTESPRRIINALRLESEVGSLLTLQVDNGAEDGEEAIEIIVPEPEVSPPTTPRGPLTGDAAQALSEGPSSASSTPRAFESESGSGISAAATSRPSTPTSFASEQGAGTPDNFSGDRQSASSISDTPDSFAGDRSAKTSSFGTSSGSSEANAAFSIAGATTPPSFSGERGRRASAPASPYQPRINFTVRPKGQAPVDDENASPNLSQGEFHGKLDARDMARSVLQSSGRR